MSSLTRFGISPRACRACLVSLVSLVSLTPLAVACGPHADFPLHFSDDIAISASFHETETRVVIVKEVAPPPATSIDGTPAPAGLNPAQAREAVDLAECWAAGGTHGEGFVRVTFNPAGTVDLVEVSNAVAGSAADTSCLSRKFGALRVTPYNGAPFVVTGHIIVG